MAKVAGKNTYFSLNAQVISTYLDKVSGLPDISDLEEVTSFGDAGLKYAPIGLDKAEITIEGWWDQTLHGYLNTVRSSATAVALIYGPQGSTTGQVRMTANCWMKDYKIASDVKANNRTTVVLVLDGALTIGVFP